MRTGVLPKFASVAGVPVAALVLAVVLPIVLVWLAPGLAAIAGLIYISAKLLGQAWTGMAQVWAAFPHDLGLWGLAGSVVVLFLVFSLLPAALNRFTRTRREEIIQCPALKARMKVRMLRARFGGRILDVTECERYGGRPLCEKFCMSLYHPEPVPTL